MIIKEHRFAAILASFGLHVLILGTTAFFFPKSDNISSSAPVRVHLSISDQPQPKRLESMVQGSVAKKPVTPKQRSELAGTRTQIPENQQSILESTLQKLLSAHRDTAEQVSEKIITEPIVQIPAAAPDTAVPEKKYPNELLALQSFDKPTIMQNSTKEPASTSFQPYSSHSVKFPTLQPGTKINTPENPYLPNETWVEPPDTLSFKSFSPSSLPTSTFPSNSINTTAVSPRNLTQAKSGRSEPVRLTEPVPLTDLVPAYPLTARRLGMEGTVLLDVSVDENGKAISCSAINPRSYSVLEKAAIQAAMETEYSPGLVNRVPSASVLRVKIVFRLE